MCYLMGQHPVELLFRDSQPLSVCAVHHQNDELGGEKKKKSMLSDLFSKGTATKCNTAGGHFRGWNPHNGKWWVLCKYPLLNKKNCLCMTKCQRHVNLEEMWDTPSKLRQQPPEDDTDQHIIQHESDLEHKLLCDHLTLQSKYKYKLLQ